MSFCLVPLCGMSWQQAQHAKDENLGQVKKNLIFIKQSNKILRIANLDKGPVS
jgi:hypothetical protein